MAGVFTRIPLGECCDGPMRWPALRRLAFLASVAVLSVSVGVFSADLTDLKIPEPPAYVARGTVEAINHPGPHNRNKGSEGSYRFECYYFGDSSISIFRHQKGSEAFTHMIDPEDESPKLSYYIGGSGPRINEGRSPGRVSLFLVACSPHYVSMVSRHRIAQRDEALEVESLSDGLISVCEKRAINMPDCFQHDTWIYNNDCLTSYVIELVSIDGIAATIYRYDYSDHDEAFHLLPRRADFTYFDLTRPDPRPIIQETHATVESMEETSETFESIVERLKADGMIQLKREGDVAPTKERRASSDKSPWNYTFAIAFAAAFLAALIVSVKVVRRK